MPGSRLILRRFTTCRHVAVCLFASLGVLAADVMNSTPGGVTGPAAEHEHSETPDWHRLNSTLSGLDPDSERARQLVPDLLLAARHPATPDVVRQRSILMLGRIRMAAPVAVPAVLDLLRICRRAETARSVTGSPPPGAASPTCPAAAQEMRVWLLKSLGSFGELANDAVPDLLRDLADRSRPVDDRVLLADVLGQIGTVSAVSALAEALRQWPAHTPPAERLVQYTIVDCIGLSGPAAVAGLPALLRTIEDADPSTRRKVCEAIGRMGPAGDPGIDALAERLILDVDPAVRDAAADALAAIGPGSVPFLIRVLRDGEPDLQWRAARSLGEIGPAAADARDELEELIRAGTPSTGDRTPATSRRQIEALHAHWLITQDSSGVFRLVMRELRHPDRQIRRRASELLLLPDTLPDDISSALASLAGESTEAGRAAAFVLRRRHRQASE